MRSARSRASETQRWRANGVGSERRLAIGSLRERHSVSGRSQESGRPLAGTSVFQAPGPEQRCQPAPATESREDGVWSSVVVMVRR